MAFEDFDVEDVGEDTQTPERSESTGESGGGSGDSGNRTFLIVAGILAAIMLLTLVCAAVYGFIVLPRSRNAQKTEVAQINAQNTAMALGVQQTEEASKITLTPTAKPTNLPPTFTATVTQVLAKPATSTPEVIATMDPRTPTVAWILTQAAIAQQTVVVTSTPVMPETGFAEDVGLPGLVGLTVVLLVVIFLARRLRSAS